MDDNIQRLLAAKAKLDAAIPEWEATCKELEPWLRQRAEELRVIARNLYGSEHQYLFSSCWWLFSVSITNKVVFSLPYYCESGHPDEADVLWDIDIADMALPLDKLAAKNKPKKLVKGKFIEYSRREKADRVVLCCEASGVSSRLRSGATGILARSCV